MTLAKACELCPEEVTPSALSINTHVLAFHVIGLLFGRLHTRDGGVKFETVSPDFKTGTKSWANIDFYWENNDQTLSLNLNMNKNEIKCK